MYPKLASKDEIYVLNLEDSDILTLWHWVDLLDLDCQQRLQSKRMPADQVAAKVLGCVTILIL